VTSERRLADSLVAEIEARVLKRLGTMAYLDYRYGRVHAVVGGTASVYLGGSATSSPGFRIPSGTTLSPGDTVRVVIDTRGDRFVDHKF
jgi:hypothetical protein